MHFIEGYCCNLKEGKIPALKPFICFRLQVSAEYLFTGSFKANYCASSFDTSSVAILHLISFAWSRWNWLKSAFSLVPCKGLTDFETYAVNR